MEILLIIIIALAIAVAIGALEAWIVMLLWNYVLCAIFTSVPTLSFWLAWGLLILVNLLFGCCRRRIKVE